MKRRTHPSHAARLFSEPQQPSGVHTAQVDGAARGNPGPASYAVIVCDAAGREVYRLGKAIGRHSNNVAEYHGLIAALDYAAAHGIRRLRIRSDSELLVRQMQGLYKVKSADLKPLHERAQKLAHGLEYFAIEHVRREMNADADRLANEALDGPGAPRASSGGDSRGSGKHSAAGARHYAQSVRAVYREGALRPQNPLNLPEGTEVEIVIRRTREEQGRNR